MSKTIPLIGQSYIYMGEDDECHLLGESYKVVETGYHWIRKFGFVVWVTTEVYKGRDIDYCLSVDVETFNRFFRKY